MAWVKIISNTIIGRPAWLAFIILGSLHRWKVWPLHIDVYQGHNLLQQYILLHVPAFDSPWSSVPNSSRRSVRASRNSIIPWAGMAIWERGPPLGLVWATCSKKTHCLHPIFHFAVPRCVYIISSMCKLYWHIYWNLIHVYVYTVCIFV